MTIRLEAVVAIVKFRAWFNRVRPVATLLRHGMGGTGTQSGKGSGRIIPLRGDR